MTSWKPSDNLEIYHIPEALQVCTSDFFFSSVELTVINEPSELFEALSHQKIGLANHCTDITTDCTQYTASNTLFEAQSYH